MELDFRPETEVTLLLCGSFARSRREELVEPLNVREFNAVLRLLERLSLSLADLLHPDCVEKVRSDPAGKAMLEGRIGDLLGRQDALATAAAHWQDVGIWAIDRTDPAYPERYRMFLDAAAPPLLYGAGDPELLNTGRTRIAIVGSRDLEETAKSFATQVGERSAKINAIVISGGARGADRIAIDGILDAGGSGIGVVPGGLEQSAKSRAYRQRIAEGQFTLISPYHPRAKFSVGNAMGRNRLIYCLADIALVVSANERRGGTWSGATEALRRGWVPLYVRQPPEIPDGICGLLEYGAHPLPHDVVDDLARFAAWLESSVQQARTSSQSVEDTRQLGLFPEG